LLEAVAERESRRLSTGVVMADDAYLGGAHAGKPGRGSENKAPFPAAVELDDEGYPLHVRFDPIDDLKVSTMASWTRPTLHKGVHLVTDGLASFSGAGAVVADHGAIIVSPRQSSDLDVFEWVNTHIANLKTAIHGTYHHFDFNKYRSRYLAEAQYHVNRRFELRSLVDRLLWTCARTEPCSESWLRLGEVRAS
jgi:hypothetical protein